MLILKLIIEKMIITTSARIAQILLLAVRADNKKDNMNNNDLLKDMDGKRIEFGHIVAVRYVWNSYVGVARIKGLCAESPSIHRAFFSPHSYSDIATYQILGHMNKDHADYNVDVFNWYKADDGECPIKIKIYNTMETVT